jgi:hypothetical protein
MPTFVFSNNLDESVDPHCCKEPHREEEVRGRRGHSQYRVAEATSYVREIAP